MAIRWEQPNLDALFAATYDEEVLRERASGSPLFREPPLPVDQDLYEAALEPAGDEPEGVTTPPDIPVDGPAGFRPASQAGLAPTSSSAKIEANLAAIDVLHTIQSEGRAATPGEQAVLARYAAWGGQGVWQVLDDRRSDHGAARERVQELLDPAELEAVRDGTTNQHFTDLALVQAMWRAVEQMGFTGGEVLEPGCGTGAFISQAPAGANMTGIEVEPTTAAIVTLLQPQATIRQESFAATNLPAGFFDLAIGNVPFSDVKLADPIDNPGRALSVHNHFIVKALRLTRPGGLVAVITSSYTMDSESATARAKMAGMADLVAAVRLPNGAHRAAAGTDALTDVLVFKRRDTGEPLSDDSWLQSVDQVLPATDGHLETVCANQYWMDHPDAVLGRQVLRVGMYGGFGLNVDTGDDVATIAAALESQMGVQASQRGGVWTPRTTDAPILRQAGVGMVDGTIVDRNGGLTQVRQGVLEKLNVPARYLDETCSLLRLRDATSELLTMESGKVTPEPRIDEARAKLLQSWQTHVNQFGPITRMIPKIIKLKDGTEEENAVAAPALRLVLSDPRGVLVTGLETWDEDGNVAPAGILQGRVIAPFVVIDRVDTALDGLAVVLDETGNVDLERIAELLGGNTTVEQVIDQLGDSLYFDPAAGQWTTSARYLSGNVRTKLGEARLAAATEPERYARNVTALENVLPPDLGVGDVRPKLGAVWISERDIETFMNSIYNRYPSSSGYVRVMKFGPTDWKIEVAPSLTDSSPEKFQWGTQRIGFHSIVEHLCEGRPIIVNDQVWNAEKNKNDSVPNPAETLAANEKASQIADRFATWVFEDPERTQRLLATYNTVFNSVVTRDYTAEGERLTLPGLSPAFVPMEHQLTAVARCIEEPSTGLFHDVGAGKTAEMIMACMELRRLGLVSKPFVVVPNHMLLQFGSEWLGMYPGAKILLADSESTTAKTKARFVAQAAMNDWDGVIMTQEAFKAIEVTPEAKARFLASEADAARVFLENAEKSPDTPQYTLKQIRKKLENMQQNLTALTDHPVIPGLCWEETGADLLVVDEIHMYKNRTVTSTSSDQAKRGAARAMDLEMKLASLRERHSGGHTLIGASGTPVANSISECWVMQNYFRPDRLAEVGLSDFDAWKTEFADSVTSMEVAGAGTQMQAKTRVARFHNVPELIAMVAEFGDIKTGADLKLKRPELSVDPTTGRQAAQPVLVDRDEELAEYMASLELRADAIHGKDGLARPEADEDNMLKVIGDGRHAALDTRLRVDGAHGGLKIDATADRIAATYQANKDRIYLDRSGNPSPLPGALQMVFCDLSTPKPGWNAYQGLKDALVARGVPEAGIRFIHEAEDKDAKEALFRSCRDGHVSVIIGSSDKMGVGTNIQDRAVALCHMDAPWRPDQVKQREGRILRPGNQNAEVTIWTMIVKGSTDTLTWQTIERKARFIDQVMHNKAGARTVEDIDTDSDQTIQYGEFKAASSQNPDLLVEVETQAEVARLAALKQAHNANQAGLTQALNRDRDALDRARERLPQLQEASRIQPSGIKGDTFMMTVAALGHVLSHREPESWQKELIEKALRQGTMCTNQSEATTALAGVISRIYGRDPRDQTVLARFGGHLFTATREDTRIPGMPPYLTIAVADAPGVTRALAAQPNEDGKFHPWEPIWPLDGIVARMRNMIEELPQAVARTQAQIGELEHRVAVNETLDGQPFNKQAELDQARADLVIVQARIAQTSDQTMAIEASPPVEDIPRNTSPDTPDLVGEARAAVLDVMSTSGQSASMRRDAGLPTLAQVRRAAVDAVAACDTAGLTGQLDDALRSGLGPDGVVQADHLRYQASLRPTTPNTVPQQFADEHIRIINVDGNLGL